MATDKRQFTMRMQDENYEKIRYLAYLEHRSIAMEIEHAITCYIRQHEDKYGSIVIPSTQLESSE